MDSESARNVLKVLRGVGFRDEDCYFVLGSLTREELNSIGLFEHPNFPKSLQALVQMSKSAKVNEVVAVMEFLRLDFTKGYTQDEIDRLALGAVKNSRGINEREVKALGRAYMEVAQREAQVRNLTQELDSSNLSLGRINSELKTLQERVNGYGPQLAETGLLREKVTTSEKQLVQSGQELIGLRGELTTYKEQLTRAERDLGKANGELEESRRKLTEFGAIEKKYGQQIKSYQMQLIQAREEILRLNEDLVNKERELAEMNSQSVPVVSVRIMPKEEGILGTRRTRLRDMIVYHHA